MDPEGQLRQINDCLINQTVCKLSSEEQAFVVVRHPWDNQWQNIQSNLTKVPPDFKHLFILTHLLCLFKSVGLSYKVI